MKGNNHPLRLRHLLSILLLFALLCIGSNANALLIHVDNTSQNGDTITSLFLGFNDLSSPDLFFMPNIDLASGETFSTDITNPNISFPGATLVFSSLLGQGNSIYEEPNPAIPISIDPNSPINIGSQVGFVSAALTFSPSTVVPEPTSLLLLGSGIAGLWTLRRKK